MFGKDDLINDEVVVGVKRYLEMHDVPQGADDLELIEEPHKSSNGFYALSFILVLIVGGMFGLLMCQDRFTTEDDLKCKYGQDIDFSSIYNSDVTKEIPDKEIQNELSKTANQKEMTAKLDSKNKKSTRDYFCLTLIYVI